ncbi:hypothetical protein BLOT_010529 [Blomia tropicalis]|nr:hypothetical protein BLOT_010529 [Blomia tropicalis]
MSFTNYGLKSLGSKWQLQICAKVKSMSGVADTYIYINTYWATSSTNNNQFGRPKLVKCKLVIRKKMIE